MKSPIRLAGALGLLLMVAGCFESERPLLQPSDYTNPSITGAWLALNSTSPASFTKLTPAQRVRQYCRLVDGRQFCGKYITISYNADGTFTKNDDGQKRFSVSTLNDGYYIGQSLEPNGSAVYAMFRIARNGNIEEHTPGCGDPRLMQYAVMIEKRCFIRNRGDLISLMRTFADFSTGPADTIYVKSTGAAVTNSRQNERTIFSGSANGATGARSTASLAAGSPQPQDILGLHVSADARYLSGRPTGSSGEVAKFIPMFGNAMYIRYTVDSLSCRRLPSSAFKCNYYLTRDVVPANSLVSFMMTLQNKHTGEKWAIDARRLPTGWTSRSLESSYAAAAEDVRRQQAASQSNGSSAGASQAVNGSIPDFRGTMCDLGSKSYCR